jgi:hypothetical protein
VEEGWRRGGGGVEGWRRLAEGGGREVVEVAYGGSEGRRVRNWRGLEEGLEGRAEEVEGGRMERRGGSRRVQFEDTS